MPAVVVETCGETAVALPEAVVTLEMSASPGIRGALGSATLWSMLPWARSRTCWARSGRAGAAPAEVTPTVVVLATTATPTATTIDDLTTDRQERVNPRAVPAIGRTLIDSPSSLARYRRQLPSKAPPHPEEAVPASSTSTVPGVRLGREGECPEAVKKGDGWRKVPGITGIQGVHPGRPRASHMGRRF